MPKVKVYSVTVELKMTIHAISRGDAILRALDTTRTVDRLDSQKVSKVFCPAEGK